MIRKTHFSKKCLFDNEDLASGKSFVPLNTCNYFEQSK